MSTPTPEELGNVECCYCAGPLEVWNVFNSPLHYGYVIQGRCRNCGVTLTYDREHWDTLQEDV